MCVVTGCWLHHSFPSVSWLWVNHLRLKGPVRHCVCFTEPGLYLTTGGFFERTSQIGQLEDHKEQFTEFDKKESKTTPSNLGALHSISDDSNDFRLKMAKMAAKCLILSSLFLEACLSTHYLATYHQNYLF